MAVEKDKPVVKTTYKRDIAIELLNLTADLKFVCKKVFSINEEATLDQWKDKLTKKGIISKNK